MRNGISPPVSKAEKARLHRQRVEAVARRQRQRENRVATQRRAIPGISNLSLALTQIEIAQAKLTQAGDNLQVSLNMAPLAAAYRQFQAEGGITVSDLQRWLNGESLGGRCHASKRHLRIVSARHARSIPRGPINNALADELSEDGTDLVQSNSGDGPEAA
jgi:hypothetical protein